MAATETTTASIQPITALHDDALTLCAISVVASMVATMLHEGLGHAALALSTGASSGVLSSVAWSSAFDSRLVSAGGTLVNLAAALLLWLLLRRARNASASLRFFLLITMAFNLFTGTGYFFYSGVTNFGDWAAVIRGQNPYWLWRAGLVVVGMAAYWGAMVVVGRSMVEFMGVPASDAVRFRSLTLVPYFTALLLEGFAGLLNPFGLRFVFESALAATAGANCGLIWLRHSIPKLTVPGDRPEVIGRSYAWITVALVLAAAFIVILGPGVRVAAWGS
jgi:hypothetical protein